MRKDGFSEYHPAVIFLFFAGAIGVGVVVMHPAYLAAGCAGAACYYLLLTGRSGIRRVVGLLPVLLLITALNPLVNTRGRHVLFSLLGRNYTFEALCYGAAIGMMFVLMLLWFQCYSLVMTSDKFTGLFGNMLPALSLLLVMVLRLIPALSRKARQISDARALIGKGPGESERLGEKITCGMGILSALTDQALEGSIVTGDSMKARGYGTGKRTCFQSRRLKLRDWLLMGVMALLLVLTGLSGGTKVMFTPILRIPAVGPGFWLYCGYLLLPSACQMKERIAWRISISRI